MQPATGDRKVRFVGDTVVFTLGTAGGEALPAAWRGMLRTTLGRGAARRRAIIAAAGGPQPLAGAEWRDLPMERRGGEWFLELPLTEVGFFHAKAYAVDEKGWQHWPDGPDAGISVHPDRARTANTIYCAFTRMCGASRTRAVTVDPELEARLKALDAQGYTVIPASGKLRDLKGQLPHIFDTLGCRILHLLPVNPTPTTGARYGRFGSPYAALDLTAIDPALVEFDRRTTGVQQFIELADAVHERGGRLFLDLVINHTGWGSTLQEAHPEWFARNAAGDFVSPGAWGNTWLDLVELEPHHFGLWRELAEVFLTWCRRGVDGFRCDAGYKVPMPVWRYVTSCVREEFPDAIFLLEGLGGAWQDTENLLTEGGMQWAYSELFQEFTGTQVGGYLDHAFRQSERVGLLVHYSETHDNDRLAARGRAWSLLRNRLSALTSANGGFGFTAGVEWLAAEKINVHSCRGLSWGHAHNLLPQLGALNGLLSEHPCFFDGAHLTRLSEPGSAVYALHRRSAEGDDEVLVLVNTDPGAVGEVEVEAPHESKGDRHHARPNDQGPMTNDQRPGSKVQGLNPQSSASREERPEWSDGGLGDGWVDLLGQAPPVRERGSKGGVLFRLEPASAYCLAPQPEPKGLAGEGYRRARAQAAWALQATARLVDPAQIGAFNWRSLAGLAARDPAACLGALSALDRELARRDFEAALGQALAGDHYRPVVTWRLEDRSRVTLVPAGHWLLVEDSVHFRATLRGPDGCVLRIEGIPVPSGYAGCYPPDAAQGPCTLEMQRHGGEQRMLEAPVQWLAATPEVTPMFAGPAFAPTVAGGAGATLDQHLPRNGSRPSETIAVAQPGQAEALGEAVALLSNGRGGMARLRVNLGQVRSKYDCVLGANLHAEVPVDRHVLVKRIRIWANAGGFIAPLDLLNLRIFTAGPPARWEFVANAGDGRAVGVAMTVAMVEGENTVGFRLERIRLAGGAVLRELPAHLPVQLAIRLDLEDRNFHWETRRNGGADHHFSTHVQPLGTRPGFAFTPEAQRSVRVWTDAGTYHSSPEWSENLPHPVEASRGMTGSGDAFSPGWFDVPLAPGQPATLAVTAEPGRELTAPIPMAPGMASSATEADPFDAALARAAGDFVVRRGPGRTVIAGYPWFLDWGRDTLICARGLIAAGRFEEVLRILVTFARFEEQGTLPNAIHGENASNRDTSDAPLWFGVACEDLALLQAARPEGMGAAPEVLATVVDAHGRTLTDVLRAIAAGYLAGTPNGVHVDPASGLVWSPSHFTWMDTNHPAGTPREGYPVEIQALWIRLLRLLDRLGVAPVAEPWSVLAHRASASLHELFWIESKGWMSDVLLARRGQSARQATPDTALRPNMLFAVSLGEVTGLRAQRCVEAAARHLVVPGGMRSLAPLPVSPPLPIRGSDGRLLNDPDRPYCGRYEGDEDTRRKPAYHNGTAWVWLLPTFCEALVRAWPGSAQSLAAARSYLGSLDQLMAEGCLGQLPENLDGDAPHAQRGCDAQAWSVTEALRVWRWLKEVEPGR